MVARYALGSQVSGALGYNLTKVRQQEARIIGTRNMPENLGALQETAMARYFELYTAGNQRAKMNCIHLSVNFSPKDQVTTQQMQTLAKGLLEAMKMSNQPALIVQHFDAGHPHFHLVTTNINAEGKRIEIPFLAHTLRAYSEEMERRHDWVGTGKNRVKKTHWEDRKKNMEPIKYPEQNLARRISTIVDITSHYRFSTLEQYNALLKKFNVKAIAIGENKGERKGMMFSALRNGRAVGTPIRSKDLLYSKQFYSRVSGRMRQEAHLLAQRVGPETRVGQGQIMKANVELLGQKGGAVHYLDTEKKEVFTVWQESGGGNREWNEQQRSRQRRAGAADYGSVSQNQLPKTRKKKRRRGQFPSR